MPEHGYSDNDLNDLYDIIDDAIASEKRKVLPAELEGVVTVPLSKRERRIVCGPVDTYGYLTVLSVDSSYYKELFNNIETFTTRVGDRYYLYFWVNESVPTKLLDKVDILGFGSYVPIPEEVIKPIPKEAWLRFKNREEFLEFINQLFHGKVEELKRTVVETIKTEKVDEKQETKPGTRVGYDKLFELNLIPKELKGLNILPAKTNKAPAIAWKEYQTKRYEGEYFITDTPAFVAICGFPIDPYGYLVVLDIDRAEIYEKFKDIETFTAKTVSGGYHLYFWVRDTPETKQFVSHRVDIKGFGSCIMLPFSFAVNKNGELKQYEVVKPIPKERWVVFNSYGEFEGFVKQRLGIIEETLDKIATKIEPSHEETRDLSDNDIRQIIQLISPYYIKGSRDLNVLYLTGYLRKAGISYSTAKKIVEILANGDEEYKNRLAVLERTYELRGAKLSPDELKGKTGLLELFIQLRGEDEAWKTIRELEKIIENGHKKHEKRFVRAETEYLKEAKKEEKLTILELAQLIGNRLLETFTIKTFYLPGDKEGEIYCYENGIYVPAEAEIKEAILKVIPQEHINRFCIRVRNEVIEWIKRNTMQKLVYEPLMIAFNNVLLDLEKYFLKDAPLKDCVEPLSPERVVFHKIPHTLPIERLDGVDGESFEALAERLAPNTTKAFKDWVGEKWLLLYEIIGYTLWLRYDLHKAIMLVGSGANGKSTYLRLIETIIGQKNKASMSLQDITEYKFAPAQLYRKLANIFPDLPKTILRNTGIFKALTGEDTITAHRKFRDPVEFTNYAKLLFSANELPEVHDTSEAFWRRWIVIEFPNKFAPNPKFFETLITEIPNVIVLALKAFKEVWKRTKFSFEETEEDYKHYWMYQSNSVYAFLYDMKNSGKLEFDTNAKTKTQELYDLYTKYCEDNEREALRKQQFTMEMERRGFKKITVRGERYYKGIKINSNDESRDTEQLEVDWAW